MMAKTLERRLAKLGSGLAIGVRGLVAKEVRSRSRGWRSMWLLTGYLAGLALAVAGFLALVVRAGGTVFPALGTQLFSSLALGFVLMLAFITPALTVGTLSGERERRTLDLLLVTRASALGLVGGKLLGSLLYILFLLVASLPAFALVYLFGGVPPHYVAMTLAVAAVTAVAHASLGLLLSAVVRRTAAASVLSYLIVFSIVLALPFASGVVGMTGTAREGGGSGPPQPPGAPPLYLYTSPMLSLASVLPGGSSTPGVPLVGDLMRAMLYAGRSMPAAQPGSVPFTRAVYFSGALPPSVAGMAPSPPPTVTVWAPWVYHFALSALFTVVAIAGATLALAPGTPRPGWSFRRAGGTARQVWGMGG